MGYIAFHPDMTRKELWGAQDEIDAEHAELQRQLTRRRA